MRHLLVAGTNDKIILSVFIAGCLHLLVLFGLNFAITEPSKVRRPLDVTLVTYPAKQPVDIKDAEYTATTDQLASGTEKEAKKPSHLSQLAGTNQQNDQQQPVVDEQKTTDRHHLRDQDVLTAKNSTNASHETLQPNTSTKNVVRQQQTAEQQAGLIAHLETRLADRKQQYAQLPRIKRFTSVKAKKSSDAQYIYQWVKKIETLGTQYYPEEAKRYQLQGHLRLLVSLYADGRVHEVRILQSSGIKILDDAATRIVRLAAPFAPFPASLKQEADRIEIIRTWYFTRDDFQQCTDCTTN